ncbi:MAG: hypothetical protein JSS04_28390 [Proteobacteria bacterium]|nr:hypothetical protein [Pseudomonadota bacterium]
MIGLLTALDHFVKADDAAANAALEGRLRAIAAALDGHDVALVPAAERHVARGVLTLDPQILLPEHDAPLISALAAAFSRRARLDESLPCRQGDFTAKKVAISGRVRTEDCSALSGSSRVRAA